MGSGRCRGLFAFGGGPGVRGPPGDPGGAYERASARWFHHDALAREKDHAWRAPLSPARSWERYHIRPSHRAAFDA